MQCRIRDLRCKEVINICDGCRIGYVEDVDIRIPEGQVAAVVVSQALHSCSHVSSQETTATVQNTRMRRESRIHNVLFIMYLSEIKTVLKC